MKNIISTDALSSEIELIAEPVIIDNEIRIDSRYLASGLGQKSHTDYRWNVLEKHEVFFSELGVVFKTTLEDGTVVWYLNEDQANFAITLSRNSKITVQFKLKLVKQLRDARALLREKIRRAQLKDLCVLPAPTTWRRRFESEYYDHLSRLTGLQQNGNARPMRWAQLTNELVYDLLPPGISEGLRACKQETKSWAKLHQFLSEDGLILFKRHMETLLIHMDGAESLHTLRQSIANSCSRMYQLSLLA